MWVTTRVPCGEPGNVPMSVATRFVNVIKGMHGGWEIASLSSAFLFCLALVDRESFCMYSIYSFAVFKFPVRSRP